MLATCVNGGRCPCSCACCLIRCHAGQTDACCPGNYNSYPRLQSLIAEFERSGTTIRPFWLTPAVATLNASGLLGETEAQ